MENTGEKIYNLRKQKGVSQEKLAFEVGVTRQTVSKWETDGMQPSIENVKCLCKFFGVESSYFFDDGEETAVAKSSATEKETRTKTLNTVITVVGMVLLALFIIACGIAAYVTISPEEDGVWVGESRTVDYVGIIFLIVGIASLAVFITLIVLLIIKQKKGKRKK